MAKKKAKENSMVVCEKCKAKWYDGGEDSKKRQILIPLKDKTIKFCSCVEVGVHCFIDNLVIINCPECDPGLWDLQEARISKTKLTAKIRRLHVLSLEYKRYLYGRVLAGERIQISKDPLLFVFYNETGFYLGGYDGESVVPQKIIPRLQFVSWVAHWVNDCMSEGELDRVVNDIKWLKVLCARGEI